MLIAVRKEEVLKEESGKDKATFLKEGLKDTAKNLSMDNL